MKNLKILISLIIIASLVFGSIAVSSADTALNQKEYIKVGLYFSSTYVQEITIKSEDGFLVYDEATGELIDKIKDTSIHITKNDTDQSGKIFMSANSDIDSRYVTIETERKTLDGKYRDGICIIVNNGLRVMNYVTLEHYVWQVVNKEMSYKNPYEALKAQAVAARTYAIQEHHTGFNVCTTTDCQVFGGLKAENETTTKACRDTEGLIAAYDGEPIRSYFSSSTGGGYSLSLSDAWGQEDVPYLQSKYDEFTPDSTGASPWKFFNTFEEIRTKLINNGYQNLGTITSFAITGQTPFGVVTEITVKGTKGTVVVPSGKIMSVFELKSKFLTIGDKDFKPITRLSESEIQYPEVDETVYEEEPVYEPISQPVISSNTCFVMTNNGLASMYKESLYTYDGYAVSPLSFSVSEQSAPKLKAVNKDTVSAKVSSVGDNACLYDMQSDVCTSGYVFWSGLGFGHGIGLSQYGAFAMADRGYKFDEILKYYYPGIDLIYWYE